MKFTGPGGTTYQVEEQDTLYYKMHRVSIRRPETSDEERYHATHRVFEPTDPTGIRTSAWRMNRVAFEGQMCQENLLGFISERTGTDFIKFWTLLAESWNLVSEKESA